VPVFIIIYLLGFLFKLGQSLGRDSPQVRTVLVNAIKVEVLYNHHENTSNRRRC